MKAAVLMFFICAAAWGQNNTTTNAKTAGNCSPIVTGNDNKFYFRYCGNDPDQEKKIIEILNAVSASEAKLNAVVEAIKPPNFVILSSGPSATPSGTNPRASVKFYIDGPDDRGQIELVCDRACSPVAACALEGTNTTLLATVSDNPNIAAFLFRRQFPPLTQCELTVESRDSKPVKLTLITFSRRLQGLVPTAAQPGSFVKAGGARMQ